MLITRPGWIPPQEPQLAAASSRGRLTCDMCACLWCVGPGGGGQVLEEARRQLGLRAQLLAERGSGSSEGAAAAVGVPEWLRQAKEEEEEAAAAAAQREGARPCWLRFPYGCTRSAPVVLVARLRRAVGWQGPGTVRRGRLCARLRGGGGGLLLAVELDEHTVVEQGGAVEVGAAQPARQPASQPCSALLGVESEGNLSHFLL
eukprot:COSAG01_NODE_4039_length_5406_cov_1.715980_2_plen_203_part_00